MGILAGCLLLGFVFFNLISKQTVSYRDLDSGISFSYPKRWGEPTGAPGNSACPEEDTYRTPETLAIFERELKFQDYDLKDTESFIRMGVRFYKMNPNASNGCNDDVLRVLAKQEMTGEEFSSFRLTTANIPGFYGVINENASRLDTEYRPQYTLFRKLDDGKISVVQLYLSFVPYAGSPEWEEIETNWKGDISSFIEQGVSATEERNIFQNFKLMAESLNLQR